MSPEQAYSLSQHPNFKAADLDRYAVSEHFTWGDVFHERTTQEVRAAGKIIYLNAYRQAKLMERIRAYLRERFDAMATLKVTSWYRSPAANAAAKGATKSLHLYGLATDFYVPGYQSVAGNRQVQAALLAFKGTARFCLEITGGEWTHADSRTAAFAFRRDGHVLTGAEEVAFIHQYGRAA
jgi:hypothetical protein